MSMAWPEHGLEHSDSSSRNWKTKILTHLMVVQKAIEWHEEEENVQTDIIRVMKESERERNRLEMESPGG